MLCHLNTENTSEKGKKAVELNVSQTLRGFQNIIYLPDFICIFSGILQIRPFQKVLGVLPKVPEFIGPIIVSGGR